MPTFSMSKHVNAPVPRTFAAFTDFRNAAQNIRAITRLDLLTDGPIGKGTRFRETRMMFKREATETMEITEFQVDRSYTLTCNSCGVLWTNTFRFSAEHGGTRVDLDMNCKAQSFLAKLMRPLAKIMAGAMKKCIDGDMEDIKRVAEDGAPKAVPA